ncbi:hypothetical protein [Streptomyces cyaneofuscatus]|uniref:hypothetical protein n=1 Tax=Streptomyces cyaneofuscatus TaxID=66883 RepID=UPI0037A99509|nr:hypothetical protein OG973_16425 [Streptomyces cyaneofuscatus]
MGARYYGADSENGDRIDDPSGDALFMMISDLSDLDNTFVVVQPDEDDPVWFASVAVLDEGGYETVRRDTTRNEHEVTTSTSINDIARDLTTWMATRRISALQARSHPGVGPLRPVPAPRLPPLRLWPGPP